MGPRFAPPQHGQTVDHIPWVLQWLAVDFRWFGGWSPTIGYIRHFPQRCFQEGFAKTDQQCEHRRGLVNDKISKWTQAEGCLTAGILKRSRSNSMVWIVDVGKGCLWRFSESYHRQESWKLIVAVVVINNHHNDHEHLWSRSSDIRFMRRIGSLSLRTGGEVIESKAVLGWCYFC